MKKSLIITLALVFVLGIVGTAFAATNPFVDVPAKHWAYGSISQLANAGIIDGYGDGTFRGDQLMTRYEMAQIVAKAMAKADKADAANKAAIDKLAVEFAAELNNLGVRVSKLEANSSTIKFTGDARFRFVQNGAVLDNGVQKFQERIRLNMAANVAKDVVFNGTLLAQNTTDTDTATTFGQSTTDQVELSVAKFTFKNIFPRADLSVGREILKQGATGLVAGTAGYYDNVRLSFGNKVKGFVAYGDISGASGPNKEASKAVKDTLTAQLTWSPSKVTSLYGFTQMSKTAGYPYEVYGGGISTKIGDFTIAGDYAVNNKAISDEDTAWYTSLWYKGADKAKVGSYGFFVDYRSMATDSIDMQLCGLNVTNVNTKGFGYGFNYTIAKNVVLLADVELLKNKITGVNHDDAYYIKTEFWF